MYGMRTVMFKVMLLGFVVFAATDMSFAGTYSGGDGTELNPYQISSVADLVELRSTPADYSAYFQQTCDLDLASELFFGAVIAADTDMGASGFQGASFTGKYDGQDYTIHNYSVTATFGLNEYVGVFGYNQGRITNLYVDNISIDLYQGQYVGLLCGSNNGAIENCHSNGTIACGDSSSYIGGLCGYHYNATLTNCSSSGSVSAGNNSSYAGGLCGRIRTYANQFTANNYATYSYSTANVSAGSETTGIGGFSGWIDCYAYGAMTLGGSRPGYGRMYVNDCYAAGSLTVGDNSTDIGGFCGAASTRFDLYYNQRHGNAASYIEYCYSVSLGGITTGTGCTNIGGFNGRTTVIRDPVNLTGNLWNMDTSGLTTSSGGTGLTDAQMRDVNSYLMFGWDFEGYTVNGTDDIWKMPPVGSAYPYPILAWHETQVDLVSISISGPDSVYENNTAGYTCTATYSDSSTEDVTNQTTWGVSDPNWATIDSSGLLASYEVSTSQSVTITAQYGGLNDSKLVAIEPVIPDVSDLLLPKADLILNRNNLAVGQITITYTGGTDKYSVVSQNPAAGTPVQSVETVDIVIYLGDQCLDYFQSDINGDCVVNLNDVTIIAEEWLNDAAIE